MEQNYNTENFEHLLKETVDDFRMYPSKRVWHSLYNDLHPAKKWPSVAVLLLLITSIMYIGVTNTKEPQLLTATTRNSNINAQAIKSNQELNSNNSIAQSTSVQTGTTETRKIKNKLNQDNTVTAASSARSNRLSIAYVNNQNSNTRIKSDQLSAVTEVNATSEQSSGKQELNQNTETTTISFTDSKEQKHIESPVVIIAQIKKDLITTAPDQLQIGEPVTADEAAVSSNKDIEVENKNETVVAKDKSQDLKTMSAEKIALQEKSWIEDFAFHNKKKPGKWNNKVAHQVYFAPSIGYRTLRKNTEYSAPPVSVILANPGQTNVLEYTLNHASALNFEVGSSLLVNISRRTRVKAGLQFNYTNYKVNAYELNNPTITTLMLNDLDNGYPVLTSRATTVANTPGPSSKNLDNNTYQISVPIGLDYRLAGNNKFKWYVGATAQPTYVAGGHSYLISSDKKNYVFGEKFMRKFNLNGGLETFVTYKTRNGVIINAGPQIRYQFFSTYSKVYTYDEKLYNLGFKVGMTTNF